MTGTTSPRKLPEHSLLSNDGLHTLVRNGEAMKTPRNLDLAVPYRAVAEAVLAECRAQTQERLDLRTMPMTQMVLTVLDVTSAKRGEIVDNIMRYGETELLCQRAEDPAELKDAQAAAWQPYLDWAKSAYGAELAITTGIVPAKQDAASLAALRAVIDRMNDYELTCLSEAVGVSGSLVLGLALATGRSSAEEVFKAAEFDRLWQIAKWGEDEEAAARLAAVRTDLDLCQRWLSLISPSA
jgi:chaperone required for assembly of F1-ATPase